MCPARGSGGARACGGAQHSQARITPTPGPPPLPADPSSQSVPSSPTSAVAMTATPPPPHFLAPGTTCLACGSDASLTDRVRAPGSLTVPGSSLHDRRPPPPPPGHCRAAAAPWLGYASACHFRRATGFLAFVVSGVSARSGGSGAAGPGGRGGPGAHTFPACSTPSSAASPARWPEPR